MSDAAIEVAGLAKRYDGRAVVAKAPEDIRQHVEGGRRDESDMEPPDLSQAGLAGDLHGVIGLCQRAPGLV